MTLLKSFCQVNGFLTWLCFMALGQGKKKPSSLDKKFDQVLESRNNNPLDSLAVWVKSQDTRNIMRHWKKNPPEQSVRRRPTAAILYYVELCPTQTNKREKKGHLLWRLGHPQIPAHDGRSTKPYKKTQKRFQDKASGGNADPLQRNRHHHHQQHRTQSKKKHGCYLFPFFCTNTTSWTFALRLDAARSAMPRRSWSRSWRCFAAWASCFGILAMTTSALCCSYASSGLRCVWGSW